MNIKDNVALVTGGASGLGRGAVEFLIKNGAKVAILDINEDKAKALIDDMDTQNLIYLNTNVMEEESVKNSLQAIKDQYGKLNFVINCAGTGYGARILGKQGPHPLDIFQFIINLNLVGTFNVMRLGAELIDKNEENEKGVIINTASIAGYEGQIGQSAYSASKAGVIGLTLTAARDLARHGIRVCTIAPGIFNTPLMQLARDENKESLLETTQFPHRFGEPEEFAKLAGHIIENSYLNGETIRLDSAMRMQPK